MFGSKTTSTPIFAPKRGLSSFTLKLVAILAMTCNHAGYIFYPHLPLAARCVLIAVGGLTYPVMAFLLVEGYVHTSDLKRYALRLLVFALVSEVPFWLFLGHKGNVLFTLLAGLALLWVMDNVEDALPRMAAVLGLITASYFCDWGCVGPLMVLIIYWFRQRPWGVAAAVGLSVAMGLFSSLGPFVDALSQGSWRNLPFVLYYALGNTAAIPLLSAYNGTRGKRPMKWLFYVYYPAHIAALGLVHLAVFGTMPSIML